MHTFPDQPDWFTEHENRDDERFRVTGERLDSIQQMLASQPTKKDLEGLATKADMDELLRVFGGVKLAGKIISDSGAWTARVLPLIAGVIIALSVIFGAWRSILGWIISIATRP